MIWTQLADGTRHVRSRSKLIQAYFESGYPHGKNRFLSINAACRFSTALTLALPAPPWQQADRARVPTLSTKQFEARRTG